MEREAARVGRNRRRLVIGALMLAVVLPLGAVAWRRGAGNFGVVESGRVYRSAQLDAHALADLIRERGIKTVLNLRGPNPDRAWYQSEVRATLDSGATQVDVPLASDQWLARDQAKALLDVIDRSEYPILIHCEFGAERTGLVASIMSLLREGSTLADARRQFSLEYLFVAFKEGRVMQGHLDAYENWLRASGKAHSPQVLREWLLADYRPKSPSREFWPCNPYPLWVKQSGHGEPEVAWSANACAERVAIGGTASGKAMPSKVVR